MCYEKRGMRRFATVLLLAVAVFIAPMRLPAASCILSNARSGEGCKPGCCANKACCVVSQKTTGPASQPFAKDAAGKQDLSGTIAPPLIPLVSHPLQLQPAAFLSAPTRAHSPPLLAANCIRLI